MATTKIFSVSADEVGALTYIANPEKTDNGRLIMTSGCSSDPLQASHDFQEIRKNGTGKSTVLCQHFIVSFQPNEITPERALLVGQEICEQYLKGEYQYFLACHIDKAHVHLHCVFNNTNCIDGRTFETHENRRTTKKDRSFQKLRDISDSVCKRHHLSVIKYAETSKGKSHWEWDLNRQGLSWKAKLKYAIDMVVKDSDDFDDFLSKCAERGILVEYNPNRKVDLKFMLAEQKENNPRAKFTRAKTLGWYYETTQIRKRIDMYKGVMSYTPRVKVRRVDEQAEQNRFIRDSIDRNNMKVVSKALNILSKYNVAFEDAATASIAAYQQRVGLVSELNRISDEIKTCENKIEVINRYHELKMIYDEYRSLEGRKKKKFEKANESEISEYKEIVKKVLELFPNGVVPSIKKLEHQLSELNAQQAKLNAEYKVVKVKAAELSQARAEIENYNRQEQERNQPTKKKNNDLE